MEYISSEQFLKQSITVQKVLRKWFKENVKPYDLYKTTDKWSDIICLCNDKEYIKVVKEYVNSTIPLLTEAQLRNFIEGKGYKIESNNFHKNRWYVAIYKELSQINPTMDYISNTLLDAYWQVVCKIAEELMD